VDYITGGATFICTIVISVLFGFFYRRAVRHLELSRNTKREQSMRAVLLVVSALVRAIVNFAFS
jgi:fatty acid desaturase